MATKSNPVVKVKDKDIELVLTRAAVRKGEEKGFFNIQLVETQPTNFLYGLAFTAAYPFIKCSKDEFDEALDGYFDQGGDYGELVTNLMMQYSSLFNIKGEEGESI